MSNNYKNSKIYRLVCKDGHYYIGATIQPLNIRFNVHKSTASKSTDAVYKYMNTVGWNNVSIELLEDFPCDSNIALKEKKKEYLLRTSTDTLCLNDKIENKSINDTIYQNSKIYRLICNDGHYYIGATVSDLPTRLNNHKQESKNKHNAMYNYIASVGWDNIKIELIEKISCYSKKELDTYEHKHLKSVLNDTLCLNYLKETVEDDTEEEKKDIENKYTNGKIYRLYCKDGHYYYGSTTSSLLTRFASHKYAIKNKTHSGDFVYFFDIPLDEIFIELIENFPCNTKEELLEKENAYIQLHRNNPLCLNTYQSYQSEQNKKEYDKQYHIEYKEKHNDTIIQYTANHRQEAIERTKKYRAEHHEEILTKEAEYREANRALLNEKQKQYVQNLSDEKKLERKQHAAEYIQQNKEHINEQYKKYVNTNREKIQLRKNAWAKKKREENADTNATELEEKQIAKDKKVKERIERDRAIHTCECGGTYQFYQKKRHIDSIKHMTFLENNIII